MRALLGMALLLSLAAPTNAADLTPMRGFHSLVAGAPEKGTRDGGFLDARFGTPAGILFDKPTYSLFVADSESGQIRQVHLREANRVSTFIPAQGGFASPSVMDWAVEPGKIWVLDKGKNNIAKLSLDDRSIDWFFPLTPGAGAPDWEIGSMAIVSRPAATMMLLAPKHGRQIAAYSLGRPGAPPVWLRPQSLSSGAKILDILAFEWCLLVIVETPQGVRRAEQWRFPGPQEHIPWRDLEALSRSAAVAMEDTAAPLGAAQAPTAFLRQSLEPARILNAQNPFGLVRSWTGEVNEEWPVDQKGRLLTTETNIVMNYNLKPLGEDQLAGKTFYSDLKHGCFEPETSTWYMSDPKNRRIVSYRALNLRGLNYSPEGIGWIDYPPQKHPNTKRIWVEGGSVTAYSGPGNYRIWDCFTRRLERYLNIFSSLKGQDTHYEMQFIGGAEGIEWNTRCQLGQFSKKIPGYFAKGEVPDAVVFCFTNTAMYFTAQDFGKAPLDEDGMPWGPFDPESFQDKDRLKTLSPDYQALVRYLEMERARDPNSLPGAPYVDPAKLLTSYWETTSQDAGQKKVFDLMAVFSTIYLKRADAEIAKGCLAAGKKKPQIFLMAYPYEFHMEKEERQGINKNVDSTFYFRYLKETAAKLGWSYIDATDPLRTLGPDTPFLYHSNHHPEKNGHELISFITALRLIEDFQ